MELFTKLMTAGLLYTSPCSHDENGTMRTMFEGNAVFGKAFRRVSENRYFITRHENSAAKPVREYKASDRYIPVSKELIERLRPEYSPTLIAISELVIEDDYLMCLHNNSAYIINVEDFNITTTPIPMADIPVFIQTARPFVPISLSPQKKTSAEKSSGD